MPEYNKSEEIDLEKTDRLPILDSAQFDDDFGDDAEKLDYIPGAPGMPLVATPSVQTDFIRHSSVDLPSLAESVRSVEERIARQNAENEALSRSYDRAKEAEAAAVARADTLAAELAAARAALDSEQVRVKEFDRALVEKTSVAEAARSRVEEMLRDSERFQSESRTLRESLAARDASIAQALHSLGERDTQLAALQQEHAKIVPALEARAQLATELEANLQAARGQSSSVALDLKSSQERIAALSAQLKRGETEVNGLQSELAAATNRAHSHLELLSTREWRRGFDDTLFRELDAEVGAADLGRRTFKTERDRLQAQLTHLEGKWTAQSATLEAERAQFSTEIASKGRALADALAAGSADAQRVAALSSSAEQVLAEHRAQLAQLQMEYQSQNTQLRAEHAQELAQLRDGHGSELTQLREAHASELTRLRGEHETQLAQLRAEHAAHTERENTEHSTEVAQWLAEVETKDQELAVVMAHLQEARRPLEPIEAEVRRLTEELAAKTAAFDEFGEENRKLRTSLAKTRGALEEREFLIRRLERSESNNANVLGRIQTSIERLGGAVAGAQPPALTASAAGATAVMELAAELVRLDGDRPVIHTLSRRTRIGRAVGCELQVDSSSVSRHHALVLLGPRDAIIEDLNSTNGVIVNGRKVTRQLLNDGDTITIGEVQFRFGSRPGARPEQPPAAELPPAGPPSSESPPA